MTLMSRKVDYALLILSYLDQRREGGCAREIADQFGLSKGFVANILKELAHKGFVASHRGAKGGYVLHRPTDEISLAELMETLEEEFHLAECTKPSLNPCDKSSVCPVKGPVAEVHRRIRDVLRGVTLAEIFHPRAGCGDRTPLGLALLSLDIPVPMP
jgi:Rrf2 family protein